MVKKKHSFENAVQFLWLFLLAVCVIVFYKTLDGLPAILASIGRILSVFTPLLIALVLFFFLSKPTAALEKKLKAWCIRGKYPFAKSARGVSVLIAYVGLFAVVGLILYALLPMLFSAIPDFLKQMQNILTDLQEYAAKVSQEDSVIGSLSIWEGIMSLSPEKLMSYFPILDADSILSTVSKSFAGVKSVSSVLVDIFVSIVLSVYICLEREMLGRFVSRVAHAFLKASTIEKCKAACERIDFIILRYFFGQFCDSLLVSIFASIVLELLRVPYGIVLGFLFGMFNLIPYFGPIIIFFVVLLITFISSGWGITLWAAALLLLIQQIDGNIINPKILGTSLNISPFWVILSVTFGGDLFGIVGMLISVPVFAVIRLFVLDFLAAREQKRLAREAAEAEEAEEADASTEEPVSEAAQEPEAEHPRFELKEQLGHCVRSIRHVLNAKRVQVQSNKNKKRP